MSEVTDQIRSYWDVDSATYDDSPGHHPRTALELAAWSGAIRRLLPAPPARVLDAGAGTGFLSLLLAQQGYDVTALELAPQMLARLEVKAERAGVRVRTVEGDAAGPPKEDFAAVVERHLLWTLPDPARTLESWREAAPSGRLVLFESEWGAAAGLAGRARSSARELLRQAKGVRPDHHGEYDAGLRAHLPLGRGTTAEALVALVAASSWGAARLERLRDVEWASRRALPSVVERAIGVPPRFAVIAG
ncbi:MAG TPA: class I SAM-dependent methyltransferase [Acidimicrobiales bacterium]|nr:class I SAM-dependent methyltransferase [Acidimicrobiales bacterium]